MYVKMKEDDKIEQHFAETDRLVSELRAANVVCAQDPQFLSLVLLLSMPSSFDIVVTAITVMALTELTYEGVKSKLLNYHVNQRQVVTTSNPAPSMQQGTVMMSNEQ